MTVDTFAEAEALVDGFGARAPGSEAEREAAEHLAGRLREFGRRARREPFPVWPRWPLAYALHALLGVAGSLVSLSAPGVGLALAFTAALLTLLDATGLLVTTRRLLGRRESHNVVSWGDRGRPGTLLLVAHHDSGAGGLVSGDGFRRRLATVGSTLHRPLSLYAILFWSLAAVALFCLLRLIGISGPALIVLQFVTTVALVIAVPLLLDKALSEAQPGENDNASGVALALRLAEQAKPEHFGVHVLFTGSQKALAQGMRAFLLEHAGKLDRGRTVVLNLDSVGDGAVRYTRREGPVFTVRSHVQLVELAREVAEDSQHDDVPAPPLINRSASDGYAVRSAGLPSITVTCRDERGFASRRLDEHALAGAEAFCLELIRRLDAEIGAVLSEAE